jgi:hypothetical protein
LLVTWLRQTLNKIMETVQSFPYLRIAINTLSLSVKLSHSYVIKGFLTFRGVACIIIINALPPLVVSLETSCQFNET